MLRILCIDDDPHIHQMMSAAFHKKGYFYASALTGGDGFSALERDRFDIVISDLKLPDMTGMDVCGRIRGNPSHAGIILALVSAHIHDIDKFKEYASELNIDLILQKPFEPGSLIDTLSMFLIDEPAEEPDAEIDDSLKELRKEYIGEFPGKLELIKKSIRTLREAPQNEDASIELQRHVHKIHGNAGIFGFAELSSIAGEWEEAIGKHTEIIVSGEGADVARESLKSAFHFYNLLEKRYLAYAESETAADEPPPLNQLGGNAANISDSSFNIELIKSRQNENKTVLLVEDDPAVQRMISYALKTRGYPYEIIGDGETAWKRIMESDEDSLPGLLVLDINLPGIDGITLLNEFQKAGKLNSMNALMLTANSQEDIVLKSFASGALDYITKPFSIPVMMHRIQIALSKPPAAKMEIIGQTLDKLWDENQKLARQNAYDSLTGVFNRQGMFNAISPLAHLARRNNSVVCVMMIDIDDFKKINDNYGHQKGDEILEKVASFIHSSLRESDIVGRFGGEEFLVFLPNVSEGGSGVVAEKIRKNVQEGSMKSLPATVSIGFKEGLLSADVENALKSLIKEADEHMYHAKKSGKNRCVGS